MNTVQSDTVWVVDDDKSIRWVLEKALKNAGIETQTFSKGDDVISSLQHSSPLAVVTDIRMPGMNGMELLNLLQQSHPEIPVIIMTAHSDLEAPSVHLKAVRLNTYQNPSTSTRP